MRLSLILSAIDRMSGPIRGASRVSRDLARRMEDLSRRIREASARNAGLAGVFRRTMLAARMLAVRGYAVLERAAYRAGMAAGMLARRVGGLAIAGVGIAGAAGVAGIGGLVRGVISTGAMFEKYQAQLEGTEKSAAGAKKALAWVANFAATTPYEIDEVTEAFKRARNAGLDPLTGSFRILGDAAAAAGEPFTEAIEMMADAQRKEFDRLKAYGIVGSMNGGMATFSYMTKESKSASKSVKADMLEIQKAVLSILEENYGGGMDRLSKTLPGIWANLKDNVTRFQLQVANAGFYDKVKGDLQKLLEWSNKLNENGTLDQWAKRVSDWLGKAWDAAKKFIVETDWEQAASDIRDVANAVGSLVQVLAGAARLVGNLNRALESLPRPPSWIGDAERGVHQFLRTPLWGGSPAPAAPARPSAPVRKLQTGDWQRALSRPRTMLETRPTNGTVSVDINLRGSGARDAYLAPPRVNGPVRAEVNRGWSMRNPG